ncbi:hypothetical protein BJ944DRAFT_267745 [Cunninghamella echinulata]|nr:hypothetical protein BJ944DRAFT_267745 [Cunninghamella echinulata]
MIKYYTITLLLFVFGILVNGSPWCPSDQLEPSAKNMGFKQYVDDSKTSVVVARLAWKCKGTDDTIYSQDVVYPNTQVSTDLYGVYPNSDAIWHMKFREGDSTGFVLDHKSLILEEKINGADKVSVIEALSLKDGFVMFDGFGVGPYSACANGGCSSYPIPDL